jgi:hypothetical protein
MNKYEFFKDQYYFELERKQNLSNSVANYVAAIALLFTFIVFYGRWVLEHNYGFGLTLFYLVLFVLIVAICLLLGALYNPEYETLIGPKIMNQKLEELENTLIEEYQANYDEADYEIQEAVINRLVEATDLNVVNNDRKAEFLHWANWAVIISFVMVAICAYNYLNKLDIYKSSDVKKVEIIGFPNEIEGQEGESVKIIITGLKIEK